MRILPAPRLIHSWTLTQFCRLLKLKRCERVKEFMAGTKSKVAGSFGYGTYEAKFKTDFNGNTRIFVRDQEVQLENIDEPARVTRR